MFSSRTEGQGSALWMRRLPRFIIVLEMKDGMLVLDSGNEPQGQAAPAEDKS